MSESKTSKRRIKAVERQRAALELRKTGATYQEIADQLRYQGSSGAYKSVMSALKRTLQEPARDVRLLELIRLDDLYAAVYQMIQQSIEDSEPLPLIAVDRCLKIMDRRAKLLGLDAPAKLQVADWRREMEDQGINAGEIFDELVGKYVEALEEGK